MTRHPKGELGIAVFGFDRVELIRNQLRSLEGQGALPFVHLWLDGDQGNPIRRKKTEAVYREAVKFPIRKIHRHRGNLGFRKMMMQALHYMSHHYERLIILEDDCFPTKDAVAIFREELDLIADDPEIFSVYGHPFLVPAEGETFTRFQGWGWATTSEKLRPLLNDLIQCFLMTEEQYLAFINKALNRDILRVIDVTPGRLPSTTLRAFFAWDETLCLLCALRGLKHKKTRKRVIYNCGVGLDSTHFMAVDYFRKPPFNMIAPDEVWAVYE